MKTFRHLLFFIGSFLTALSIIVVILSWAILNGTIPVAPSTYLFGQWCYQWWWVPEVIGISCLILWGLLFRWASPPEARYVKRRRGNYRRR